MALMKKGDRVLVWSLQSFNNGGFLKSEPAFLRQDQNGDSVLLCVIRNYGGKYKIDECYEVYDRQVKKVSYREWRAATILSNLRKRMMTKDANNT